MDRATADSSSSTASATATDRVRWQALLEVDPDIAAAAAEVRDLGSMYEEMLAERYMTLGDKTYLPAIVEKVKAFASEGGDVPIKEVGVLGKVHYRRLASGGFVVTKGHSVGRQFAKYAELEEFSRLGR